MTTPNYWLQPAPARIAAGGAFERLPAAEPGRRHDAAAVPPGAQAAWLREREWADGRLQWSTFHRMRRVNANHASSAWQYRYSMPLSPHALAFLFHQADPRTGGITVTAATRTWPACLEAQHAIPILEKLTVMVRDHLTSVNAANIGESGAGVTRSVRTRKAAQPVWDVRTELADRCDPDMAADAVYAGLGFSTLDTTAGSFTQHCAGATNELDIPGAFCLVANPSGHQGDLQMLTAERAAARDTGTISIQSFEALTTDALTSDYPYMPVSSNVLLAQSPHAQVLHRMWHLDQALRQADIARRETIPGQPTRRRGRSS